MEHKQKYLKIDLGDIRYYFMISDFVFAFRERSLHIDLISDQLDVNFPNTIEREIAEKDYEAFIVDNRQMMEIKPSLKPLLSRI